MWKKYSLSLTLLVLFVSAWLGQAVVQWYEFADDQAAHGQEADVRGYALVFLRSTLENWQSEALQLILFTTLTVVLVHRGSPQSRDGQDRMEAKLDDALARLRRLEERP